MQKALKNDQKSIENDAFSIKNDPISRENESILTKNERFSQRPHPLWWLLTGSLLAIAICIVGRPAGLPFDEVALGQTTAGGARGVFAFSGQLSKSNYGVFLVDTDTMTIWAYEFLPQKGCMRLAASRTWRYDRYLENHNICDLPPEMVEEMVDQQRQYRMEKAREEPAEPPPSDRD